MKRYLSEPTPAPSEVNCSRGAPMGRRNIRDIQDPEMFNGTVRLAHLPMTCYGDYDSGGAYWGCGNRETGWMYRAYFFAYNEEAEADDHLDLYIRAVSREAAKAQVLEEFPNARFYR